MKIESLYYITHKDNLSSILESGIFSSDRAEAEGLHPTPVYDGRGVEQRNSKTTDGISLWVYANLYFQPRNAMMYRIIHQKDLKDLAVVGINKKVLDEADVVITDGNAANETTQFYCLSEGLKILKRHGSIIQKRLVE